MKPDLKVSQIAKKHQISPESVRALIKTGHLKARDINAGTGRRPHFRVSAQDYENWLKQSLIAQ